VVDSWNSVSPLEPASTLGLNTSITVQPELCLRLRELEPSLTAPLLK
jgi:hypothetical protein